MTASGLRREHRRGRLIIERTAGKDYTTLAFIERMRELCCEEDKDRASGSGKHSTAQMEDSHALPSGSSKMANTAKALDVAKRIVEGLKEHSPTTSLGSTSMESKPASVHQLRSR